MTSADSNAAAIPSAASDPTSTPRFPQPVAPAGVHASVLNREAAPADHPAVRGGRTGMLLVNLGTPDGTDYGSMRRYLSEFLSDRRVIEVPPLIWQPILQGIILTFRPSKSGAAYKTIWRDDADGSPLRHYTRLQGEALATRLAADGVQVDWAMRYGRPSIAERLAALKDAGCDRIVLMPLYPQYSATTTASVVDKTAQALGAMRWQPALRVTPPFHDDPAYIEALAGDVERQLAALDFEPQVLVLSFHGLPQSYFKKGDPYHCHCAKTARLLRERLGWSADRVRLTFQSRFGPTQWLQPYTDKTIEALPGEGITRVAVAMPGFLADCLETLEEIAEGVQETFMHAGGERFAALSCLNDSAHSIAMLEALARRELAGWVANGAA